MKYILRFFFLPLSGPM